MIVDDSRPGSRHQFLKVPGSIPGLGTSFGDINQTDLCMILCLFHSAKAKNIILVTYIMMTNYTYIIYC